MVQWNVSKQSWQSELANLSVSHLRSQEAMRVRLTFIVVLDESGHLSHCCIGLFIWVCLSWLLQLFYRHKAKSLEYCYNKFPIIYHIFSVFNITAQGQDIVLESVPRCLCWGSEMFFFWAHKSVDAKKLKVTLDTENIQKHACRTGVTKNENHNIVSVFSAVPPNTAAFLFSKWDPLFPA